MNLRKARSVLSFLSFAQLRHRSNTLAWFFGVFVLVTPRIILRLFLPQLLRPLAANTLLFLKMNNKSAYVCKTVRPANPGFRYATSVLLDSLLAEDRIFQIRDELQESLSADGIESGKLDACLSWAFWNLDHNSFGKYLNGIRTFLETLSQDSPESQRYMPDYSANLGHLSCLYMYILYYGLHAKDTNRQIILIDAKSANSFYLDLITRWSPLEVKLVDSSEIPKKSLDTYRNFDHLLYSFESSGRVRIESDASPSYVQDYPEWSLGKRNQLRLSEQEQLLGYESLESILKGRWFIALHIRQALSPSSDQARNANIEDYRLLCEFVKDLGGLVIRMGDPRFPVLSSSFPAFDYAHSPLRSESLDCWLWANMNCWVGNVSGAMLTAFTFGKTRLITNQWYWNLLGNEEDMVIPKLIRDKRGILSIEETMETGLSRQMNPNIFRQRGFSILDNSPTLILDSFRYFMNHTGPAASLGSSERVFRSALGLEDSTNSTMRLSPAFMKAYENRDLDASSFQEHH